jgi:hypothetical protein
MIAVDRTGEDEFTVVTDDLNAENAALEEAIEDTAPHLLADYAATQVGPDGKLMWTVERAEWVSLLEIIDALAASGNVNPAELDEMEEKVELGKKEVQT